MAELASCENAALPIAFPLYQFEFAVVNLLVDQLVFGGLRGSCRSAHYDLFHLKLDRNGVLPTMVSRTPPYPGRSSTAPEGPTVLVFLFTGLFSTPITSRLPEEYAVRRRRHDPPFLGGSGRRRSIRFPRPAPHPRRPRRPPRSRRPHPPRGEWRRSPVLSGPSRGSR